MPAVAIDREGRYFIGGKVDNGEAKPASKTESKNSTRTRILIQRVGEAPSVLSLEMSELAP